MEWQALTAIAALLTVVVIAASGAVAIFQLRELRKAAQLQSFLSLMG